MDSKLQLFAKVLLKEHYDEFLEMIQLFNIDKRTFVPVSYTHLKH